MYVATIEGDDKNSRYLDQNAAKNVLHVSVLDVFSGNCSGL